MAKGVTMRIEIRRDRRDAVFLFVGAPHMSAFGGKADIVLGEFSKYTP